MQSILRYPERGWYGNKNFRGNCSGYVIKDLINFYFPNRMPEQFIEVFSGGGTGADVALELGIYNSIHLDFVTGWDALVDPMPVRSDLTFSHPPYWNIIDYNRVNGAAHKNELSSIDSYEDFIEKLNVVNRKIYENLCAGGLHIILVGDIRKQGKYYSIIKDMQWFGELKAHLIKEQFNTVSGNKRYSRQNFIPISHEHILVFEKGR